MKKSSLNPKDAYTIVYKSNLKDIDLQADNLQKSVIFSMIQSLFRATLSNHSENDF
jgi:hypothetical protein